MVFRIEYIQHKAFAIDNIIIINGKLLDRSYFSSVISSLTSLISSINSLCSFWRYKNCSSLILKAINDF